MALSNALRPELHRYAARLMGSVIDGEDVVQDTFARAIEAIDEERDMPSLRAWLFRIAHNRALDLLRRRAFRATEPIEAADEIVDSASADPVETLMRQEAIETAVERFTELPVAQRSAVILKDVLDLSLQDIADTLDLTVNAVKAHLARGRARLKEINAQAPIEGRPRPASPNVARYVALFNGRDWVGLRAMLADDVRLGSVDASAARWRCRRRHVLRRLLADASGSTLARLARRPRGDRGLGGRRRRQA
jgi:RNA polymerase sigma factor (sigma-70 family)